MDLQDLKKRNNLTLAALGISAAVFVIAGVVGLIVWNVVNSSSSNTSSSEASESSSTPIIGQIPLTMYGTMWANEPLGQPPQYSFPNYNQYWIEIKMKITNNDCYLIALDHPGVASHISLYIDENNNVVHHRAVPDCDIQAPIALGEVHTIAAGFDGTNTHLLIDGVEVASSSACGALPQNSTLPLIICAVQGYNSTLMEKYAHGDLYYVKIYGSYDTVNDSTLLAYYNFANTRSPAIGYQFVNQSTVITDSYTLTLQSVTDSAGIP